MPKPRANFSCKNCARQLKSDTCTLEDLPVDSVRCPYCGHKRGFTRLFDGFGGILGSQTRTLDKVLTQTMEPLHAQHAATVHGAQNFERAATDALARSVHEAPASARAQARPFGGQVLPAGQALSAIPPAARQDSREVLYPALTNRRVRPNWER